MKGPGGGRRYGKTAPAWPLHREGASYMSVCVCMSVCESVCVSVCECVCECVWVCVSE